MPFWNKPESAATVPVVPESLPLRTAAPQPAQETPDMPMLKRDDLTAAAAPSAAATAGDLNALLGRGSEFEGKLTFEGTVRIDGKFTGSIVTGDVLVVGEGAKISAEITCGTIIVHGEVQGNIRAKNACELHHPAKMRGNVETPSFMVEKGVIFEGQCKMEGLSFDARPNVGKPEKKSEQPPAIAAVKS